MYRYEFVGERPIKTLSGLIIAEDFTRIVLGGRGAYVEFSGEQIYDVVLNKLDTHHYYYIEMVVDKNIKVYFQLHTVKYADYKVHMYYISPIYLQGFIRVGKV